MNKGGGGPGEECVGAGEGARGDEVEEGTGGGVIFEAAAKNLDVVQVEGAEDFVKKRTLFLIWFD
jgi:hypothetical protein